MSKEDAAWVVGSLWTGSETPEIHSLEEYQGAMKLYAELVKSVPSDEFRSPAAMALTALGAAMIAFEEAYEQEHGHTRPET